MPQNIDRKIIDCVTIKREIIYHKGAHSSTMSTFFVINMTISNAAIIKFFNSNDRN